MPTSDWKMISLRNRNGGMWGPREAFINTQVKNIALSAEPLALTENEIEPFCI